MNRISNIGRVILFIISLTMVSRAESLGFFGLASKESSAGVDKLLAPLLPKGLGDLQFGDSREEVFEKRKGAETEKRVSAGVLLSETVPTEKRITGDLNIYDVSYGYDEGKGPNGRGLDSLTIVGFYDDKSFKFDKIKALLSACFLALGTPSEVITVDVYGDDKVPVIFIYWDSAKCPVWLQISRSITRDRMNLFLEAALPRTNVKGRPRPAGVSVKRPSGADFKRIYDLWLVDALKPKD